MCTLGTTTMNPQLFVQGRPAPKKLLIKKWENLASHSKFQYLIWQARNIFLQQCTHKKKKLIPHF